MQHSHPHLNYTPPGGWQSKPGKEAEKLVKTHCCFCGQQCGIQLKVRDHRVIGFEPWEEFPFNRGMLCPKGVKRYLQGNHPDRLLDPLMRTADGFRTASWDESLDFTARRLRELQEKYGKDSVAVYGGASLTTEKSYLIGKFARVGLGTRHCGMHIVPDEVVVSPVFCFGERRWSRRGGHCFTFYHIYSPFLRPPCYAVSVPDKWCTVTILDADGRRHSLDLQAASSFDAAHIYVCHAKEHPERGSASADARYRL